MSVCQKSQQKQIISPAKIVSVTGEGSEVTFMLCTGLEIKSPVSQEQHHQLTKHEWRLLRGTLSQNSQTKQQEHFELLSFEEDLAAKERGEYFDADPDFCRKIHLIDNTVGRTGVTVKELLEKLEESDVS